MATTYDETQKHDAIEKVKAGSSVYSVAKSMGASPATVRRWAQEAGVIPETEQRQHTSTQNTNNDEPDYERIVGRLTIENMQLRELVHSS